MKTKRNIKIVLMVLWVFAVSAAYSEDKISIDSGTFEELPEERKLNVKKIQKEFGDEVERIYLNKNRKRCINIFFEDDHQDTEGSKNNIRDLFLNTAKKIKIDDKDSNSIRSATDEYEKKGMDLLVKAGYQNRSGFSLKLDTARLNLFGPLSKKRIFEDGNIVFIEYYNGIEIEKRAGLIAFNKGKITNIGIDAIANDEISISTSEPRLTFDEVTTKYLSSSEKITPEKRPSGKLIYILKSNQSLVLCWRIDIDAGINSKRVWINALTGQIEEVIPTVKN